MNKHKVTKELSERRAQVADLQQKCLEQGAFIDQLLQNRDVLRYVGSLEEKLTRIKAEVDKAGWGAGALVKTINAILADGTFDKVQVREEPPPEAVDVAVEEE